MIPISEIEKVISQMEISLNKSAHDYFENKNEWDKGSMHQLSTYLVKLKELLPK